MSIPSKGAHCSRTVPVDACGRLWTPVDACGRLWTWWLMINIACCSWVSSCLSLNSWFLYRMPIKVMKESMKALRRCLFGECDAAIPRLGYQGWWRHVCNLIADPLSCVPGSYGTSHLGECWEFPSLVACVWTLLLDRNFHLILKW